MDIKELNSISKDYKDRLNSLMSKADDALSNGIKEYESSLKEVTEQVKIVKNELVSIVDASIKEDKDKKASKTLEEYKKMFSSFGLDK